MKKFALTLLYVFLLWVESFAQNTKNINTIFHGYSLQEYIYWNANIPFSSHDFNSLTPLAGSYFSDAESRIVVFINGNKIETDYMSHADLFFPNYSLSEIDSINVDLRSLIKNGIPTPNGSIEIFLEEVSNNARIEYGLVNQVNDPGPLESTTFKTPNVEAIDRIINYGLTYQSSFDIRVDLENHLYSQSNALVYDRHTEFDMVDRITNNRTLSSFYQGNQNQYVFLTKTIGYNSLDLHYRRGRFFQNVFWDTALGNDRVNTFTTNTFTFTYSNKKLNFFNGFSFTYHNTATDILKSFNYYIDGTQTRSVETVVRNSYSWFNSYLTSSFIFRRDTFTAPNLTTAYNAFSWNLHLKNFLGTETQFVLDSSFQSVQIRKSTLSVRYLQFNPIEYSHSFKLADDRLFFGKTNLYPLNPLTIQSNTDLLNYINLNQKYVLNRSPYSFNLSTDLKHYFNYIDYSVTYFPISGQTSHQSESEYKNLKDITVAYASLRYTQLFRSVQLESNIKFSTQLFGTNIKSNRRPNFLFNQIFKYNLNKSAEVELSYKYSSVRRFNEYEFLQESITWPPVRVRPFHQLNFTTRLSFVNQRLHGIISLRNILNSTESYDTNGEYYNMSIHVGLSASIQ